MSFTQAFFEEFADRTIWITTRVSGQLYRVKVEKKEGIICLRGRQWKLPPAGIKPDIRNGVESGVTRTMYPANVGSVIILPEKSTCITQASGSVVTDSATVSGAGSATADPATAELPLSSSWCVLPR